MLQLNRAPSRQKENVLAGRYCLHEEIGRGRFGEVYRANDLHTGTEVAIKFAETGSDQDFAQKIFENERGALSRLDHPSVVKLAGSGASDEGRFLAMEYIPGVNLKQFLRGRKFSAGIGLGIMREVCDSLAAIHCAGIVHRDLKPKNAMVASGGRIKLIDFGFSRVEGMHDPTCGFSKSFGSPVYSPPEDLRDNPDRRADIYSAGVMLYELLMERSRFYLIDAIKLLELRVSLARVRDEISGRAGAKAYEVIMQATEKDPGRRFQSAVEMGEALRSITG